MLKKFHRIDPWQKSYIILVKILMCFYFKWSTRTIDVHANKMLKLLHKVFSLAVSPAIWNHPWDLEVHDDQIAFLFQKKWPFHFPDEYLIYYKHGICHSKLLGVLMQHLAEAPKMITLKICQSKCLTKINCKVLIVGC